jgi:uroporphyrinogen-III synthase
LPRAQKARDLIPEGLKRRGARIDVVPAYQTVIPEQSRDRAAEIFSAGATPDWVTFTSSSTVTHFVELCGAKKLDGVRVASIGPITTATARQLGIEVHVEPREYTVAGLIQAIVDAQLGMAV